MSILTHFRGPHSPDATLRTDNTAVFTTLQRTNSLKSVSTTIELGWVKNINKNPIAECSIQELESEIKSSYSTQHHLSQSQLDMAVAHLNARLRSHGLSATELLQHRNQFTGQPLPLNEETLIQHNLQRKTANHPHSTKSKSGRQPPRNIHSGRYPILAVRRVKTPAKTKILYQRYTAPAYRNPQVYRPEHHTRCQEGSQSGHF